MTDGLAGADLENIVNLAALQSVRKAYNLKLEEPNLEGSEFVSYVDTFLKEKRKSNNP